MKKFWPDFSKVLGSLSSAIPSLPALKIPELSSLFTSMASKLSKILASWTIHRFNLRKIKFRTSKLDYWNMWIFKVMHTFCFTNVTYLVHLDVRQNLSISIRGTIVLWNSSPRVHMHESIFIISAGIDLREINYDTRLFFLTASISSDEERI